MKTNFHLKDFETKQNSNCTNHFDISVSSESLGWASILLEKGKADYFHPEHVYSDNFFFTVELTNTFDWTVYTGEEENITSTIGSIWINSPHSLINHRNDHPAEFIILAVEPKALFDHYDQTVSFNKLQFITDYSVEDKVLESIINLFYEEAKSGNKNGCNYVDHLLKVLSNYFINNYSNIRSVVQGQTVQHLLTEEHLKNIDNYVNTHLSESITIDNLASIIQLDKFSFLNAFKTLTGLTPYQHILNLRIGKAKELMMTTNETLVNIALDTGFNDSSHFSKTFKKHTGLTPKAFRQSLDI